MLLSTPEAQLNLLDGLLPGDTEGVGGGRRGGRGHYSEDVELSSS